MNQRSLDEIVAEAIDRAQSTGIRDENAITEQVLQDQDVKILLAGYDMHDRAEGLEDVMVRDIRRKVHEFLQPSDNE